MWSKRKGLTITGLFMFAGLFAVACGTQTVEVEVTREVEVEVEVIKEVPVPYVVEVIKEVPVEIIVEVPVIVEDEPGEALLAAQFVLGLGVGAEYVGVTLRELKRDVLAGIGYCVLLSAIALVFAEIVISIGAAPPMEAFLAFAPGGQSEMAILAIVAGADLAYVVTHHLVRLVVVIIGAPIVARLVR